MFQERNQNHFLYDVRISQICPVCKGKKKVDELRWVGNRKEGLKLVKIKVDCFRCFGHGYMNII